MSVFNGIQSCTTVDPNPQGLCSIDAVPYGYVPHTWVGAIFTAIHCIFFIFHASVSGFRWSRANFMLLAAVCSMGEAIGWGSRIRSSSAPFDTNAYIAQLVVLIISPVFISAANYITLERIIDIVGQELSRIGPKRYLALFLTGDILSLIIQAVGGGMAATAANQQVLDRGTNIMIAGVSVQVAVTLPFILLFLDFHIRHYRRYLAASEEEREQAKWTKNILRVSLASSISTLMILTRCIYRTVEMAQGWKGYLAGIEAYFAVLDGIVIAIAVGIFIPFHPGFLFPPRERKPEKSKPSKKSFSTKEASEEMPTPASDSPSSASLSNQFA